MAATSFSPSSIATVAVATSFSPSSIAHNLGDNLGPQPGSRNKGKRKGRGHVAGQGGSCGFGMRGQKSRSGPGVCKGCEGGQMPLYRRIPNLRGIAGGMRAGLPKYVPVNLKDIEAARFKEGEDVSLESLKEKGLINPLGRERTLPLKAKL
ncbi:Ribosomal protein L18e/L15P, partial [Dillenia turbinata]